MAVTQEQADWFAGAFTQLVANVDKAILGKEHSIRLVITAMLSGEVERDFLEEFIAAYEFCFAKDPAEFETMKQHSATHRRTFTRLKRPIFLIAREGGFLKVLPAGKGIVKVKREDLPRIGVYKSERSYAKAVKAAGGTLPEQSIIAN